MSSGHLLGWQDAAPALNRRMHWYLKSLIHWRTSLQSIRGGCTSWATHWVAMGLGILSAAVRKCLRQRVPMAGEGDVTLAENIVDVPVWAFHGRFDRNVPVSGSRNIIEALRKAGGNPKYTEYPFIGHRIWGHVEKTPELMGWVFAQQRE